MHILEYDGTGVVHCGPLTINTLGVTLTPVFLQCRCLAPGHAGGCIPYMLLEISDISQPLALYNVECQDKFSL